MHTGGDLDRALDQSPILTGFVLGCSLLMTLSLALYGFSPLIAMRLPWRYLLSAPFFPVYMAWKLMVAAKGRPDRWVRTEREKPRQNATAKSEDKTPTAR